ncbi:hypothetical protein ACVJH7_004151 [Bradyrhizobium elkanii]
MTRFGTRATVTLAPTSVPITRKNAFELVAPASGWEVM